MARGLGAQVVEARQVPSGSARNGRGRWPSGRATTAGRAWGCEAGQDGMAHLTSAALSRCKLALMLAALTVSACSAKAPPSGPRPVTRVFDADGITRVVLRASGAEKALVEAAAAGSPRVSVTGTPEGGAAGYHSADPAWQEVPAAEWGLDFVSRRFGPTLVVSTKNEIAYIHHHYVLANLRLRLPAFVVLVRQTRRLTGDGGPDLAPP